MSVSFKSRKVDKSCPRGLFVKYSTINPLSSIIVIIAFHLLNVLDYEVHFIS